MINLALLPDSREIARAVPGRKQGKDVASASHTSAPNRVRRRAGTSGQLGDIGIVTSCSVNAFVNLEFMAR